MKTLAKHRSWTFWASLFSVAAALTGGFYVGYQHGFHAYYKTYIDALIENVHYVGNPVDCAPCNEEETYEWFFAAPRTYIHQPEGESTPNAKQKGGETMGP